MVKPTARKGKAVITVPKSHLTLPSQRKSKKSRCSSKLESVSALRVASQKLESASSLEKTPKVSGQKDVCPGGEGRGGVDMDGPGDGSLRVEADGGSGIAGSGGGTSGAVSTRKQKRRKKKRKNRNLQSVAIARGVADPAINRESVNPKDGGRYLETGGDRGLKRDGGTNMAATRGGSACDPSFALPTPARNAGKQVPDTTASSSAIAVDQSAKKRKATEPADLPGDTPCGSRKRARVNFKETGYTKIPSPRDIPFNYSIRRRSKWPIPLWLGAEEKPPQEGRAGRSQIQDLAAGEAEKLNQLIEECLEEMLESESPIGGSPIGPVAYSARNPGPFEPGQDMVQLLSLSAIPTSEPWDPVFPGESLHTTQSLQDSPVKPPPKPSVALEESTGEVGVSPENELPDVSSRAQEITPPLCSGYHGFLPALPATSEGSWASSPILQAYQAHLRRPRASRGRSISQPPDRRTRNPPYFLDQYEGLYEEHVPVPRTKGSRNSSHFSQEVGIKMGNSVLNWPRDDDMCYGLFQEELKGNPFQLLVACMFLNVTSGVRTVSKIREFLQRYPDPKVLAQAKVRDVTEILDALGLRNRRAGTLIDFGREWLRNPPTKYMGARKPGYPRRETLGALAFPGVCPVSEDERFEIAHLPGVGPYALDSWRIFCLDDFRGNQGEEEWTRVTPLDKELRGLLRWRWSRKGVRWIEECDNQAFKKFWVMRCNGLVCHNMCKAGLPTQRCPHEEVDLADPENHRGRIPPEFVIGGGRKELIEEQTDTPDPAVMADYIFFGHGNAETRGGGSGSGGKPPGGGEPTRQPLTIPALQRQQRGTDIQLITVKSRALLWELRKRAPWAEGIIKGNHRLRWIKDSNTADGTPSSPTHLETAGIIYYALDPPRNYHPQITPAVDLVHPEVPAPPKPQKKWSPPQGPAYEPPVSSQRRLKYTSKA